MSHPGPAPQPLLGWASVGRDGGAPSVSPAAHSHAHPPLQWHMELPSGLLSLWTRTHSPGVPHQSCSCSPWEAPSCQVGGPGADVDTGREAAEVPRGSLLSYVRCLTRDAPAAEQRLGTPSPHGTDLECSVMSLRCPSAAWGAVHLSTSMYTPALHPAGGSVGVRHPCFQRSPLCNYAAAAVYTVKETGRCRPDPRTWPAQGGGQAVHTSS